MATRHGPALSADSVTYLSAANRLGAGLGYTDFTGGANTTFPPAFSTLLAILGSLGVSLTTAARVANAAFFGGVVALTWVVSGRHTRSSFVRLGATAAVAVSPAMLNLADHAWSEPAFCVVVLLFMLALEDSVTRDCARTRSAATAGVIVGGAFLVRYAGAILIPVGVLVLAIALRRAGRRVVVARVTVFLSCALFVPSLWLLRNASTAAPYVLGPRTIVADGIDSLAQLFAVSFGSLFVPSHWTHNGLVIAIPVVLLAAAVSTLPGAAPDRRRDGRTLLPLASFVVIYPLFVVGSGKLSGSSIDGRIVAPLYPPAVILVAVALEEALRRAARTRRLAVVRPTRLLLVGAALAAIAGSTFVFVRTIQTDGAAARGYASTSYRRSPLAGTVRTLRAGFLVATNRPWALYVATNHEPIVPAPGPLYPSASLAPATKDTLDDQACVGRVYVAWYGSASTPPSDRVGGLRLRKLRAVTDGTLYQVEPTDPDCLRGRRVAVGDR